MLPRNHPDGIQITFDDHRLVANAGLLLPATLARHLGQRELVGHHPELGGAPGRTNHRRQDDDPGRRNSDELRIGGTVGTLGGTVKAPSTLDTLQHSFQWSHVRPTGPVEPRVAGPGLAGRRQARRRVPEHLP